MIKVLIADDHPIIRAGLKNVLEDLPGGFLVVEEANDGNSALEKILCCKPDLVFIDLSMPQRDGIDVVEKVLGKLPDMVFVVLTMHNNPHYHREGVRAGIKGYLLKEYVLDEIEDCMAALNRGKSFVSRYLKSDEEDERADLLTRREKEILKGLLKGESNRLLAERLFCSVKNVERLKTKMRKKLDLSASRSALISWAVKNRKLL